VISNGNRTEWSPIRSVIIRVITMLLRQLVAVDQLCGGYEVLLYRSLSLYERLCALLET